MPRTVQVPDMGDVESAEVIEICVTVGDLVEKNAALIVLESEKASMEIPSPWAGKVLQLKLAEGDRVQSGTAILEMETDAAEEETAAAAPAAASYAVAAAPAPAPDETAAEAVLSDVPVLQQASAAAGMGAVAAEVSGSISTAGADTVHAGPAVRRMARELGVELHQVSGSGPRGRILKEDVERFVQHILAGGAGAGASAATGGIPAVPLPDFALQGAVHEEKMNGVQRAVARGMRRSWLNVPHVTQFDDADVNELEHFRSALNQAGESPRLTLLPFVMKAVAAALLRHPRFNAALREDGEALLVREYIHIGMAVDTEAGLLVPVLRNVDKKGVRALAEEIQSLAERARSRSLAMEEMQGGCFTVSSLGAAGGTGFTPIVNAPEAAILGISRLAVKPVYRGGAFQPCKMLPLCLSYDHRIVNGADAGRFLSDLCAMISDSRRILL